MFEAAKKVRKAIIIIGSVKGRMILEYLHEEGPQNQKKMIEELGLKQSEVSLICSKFQKIGLLTLKKVGKNKVATLNYDKIKATIEILENLSKTIS